MDKHIPYFEIDLDGEKGRFVWKEGKVCMEDFEVENELIAHKIANLQPPLCLLVWNQIEKELKSATKAEFEDKANHLLDDFNRPSYDPQHHALPLSVAIWLSGAMGSPILGHRSDVPQGVIDWMITHIDAKKNPWKYESLHSAMAHNKGISSQNLDKLARVGTFRVQLEVVSNSNISQETLAYVLTHSRSEVIFLALKKYRGQVSREVCEKMIPRAHSWGLLASMKIDPITQEFLFQKGGPRIRKTLLKNEFVEEGIKRKIRRDVEPVVEREEL